MGVTREKNYILTIIPRNMIKDEEKKVLDCWGRWIRVNRKGEGGWGLKVGHKRLGEEGKKNGAWTLDMPRGRKIQKKGSQSANLMDGVDVMWPKHTLNLYGGALNSEGPTFLGYPLCCYDLSIYPSPPPPTLWIFSFPITFSSLYWDFVVIKNLIRNGVWVSSVQSSPNFKTSSFSTNKK